MDMNYALSIALAATLAALQSAPPAEKADLCREAQAIRRQMQEA